jgi:hypothetical protein
MFEIGYRPLISDLRLPSSIFHLPSSPHLSISQSFNPKYFIRNPHSLSLQPSALSLIPIRLKRPQALLTPYPIIRNPHPSSFRRFYVCVRLCVSVANFAFSFELSAPPSSYLLFFYSSFLQLLTSKIQPRSASLQPLLP